MKRKTLIAMVTCIMVITSSLVGCSHTNKSSGSSGTSSNGVKGDPITFTMFNGWNNQVQFPEDNEMSKWVEEQTGVKIKVEYLVGDLKTKVGVMVASGTYPDFIWASDQQQKFVDAGACIDLNSLLEKYGTNLKKTEMPIINKAQQDGKLYYVPPYREGTDNSKAARGFYVQKRVLKDAGYPKITTLDQYFKILEDYKAKNPTTDGNPTIPFDFISDQSSFWTLTNPPSDMRGFENDGVLQFDEKTIEGKLYAANDDSKNYWKKLNQEWDKGMLDTEGFTQKLDAYTAKLASGRVLGFYDQWWQFTNVQNQFRSDKKDEYQYVAFPLTWDSGIKDHYQSPNVPIIRDGISISKDCKDPDRAFKFMEWLMSEDVQKRINWGVKDVDYTVDSTGHFVKSQAQRDQLKSLDYQKKKGYGAFAYPWPVNSVDAKYSDGNWWFPGSDPKEIQAGYSDSDKEVLKAYNVDTFGQMFNQFQIQPWGQAWDVSLTDGSNEQLTYNKIDELQRLYVPKMIMAKPDKFDDIWNQYKSEVSKLDVKGMEDFITKAIQARVKQWSGKK